MAEHGEKETYRFVKGELLPRSKEFDDIHNLDKVRDFCVTNI